MIFRALLLLVLISIHQTSCCLPCIRESEQRFREFKYFLNEQHENVREFHALKVHAVKLYDRFVNDVAPIRLDRFSMKQLEMEFKKTIDLIENSQLRGTNLASTMGVQFSKLYEKLNKILGQQFSERFCPNLKSDRPCGMMEQTVTHCGSCKEEKNFCVGGSIHCRGILSECPLCLCDSKGKCHNMRNGKSCKPCEGYTECMSESINCGARYLQVEEREDIVFDCNLDWHHKLEHRLEYVFELISNGRAKVLSTTDESILEKKFSSKSDEGEYRCTARLMNKVPVSSLTYNVKIIPSRVIYYKTKPTLPPEETTPTVKPTGLSMEQKLTYGSIILAAVCAFLLLIFAISIYMYRRRQNQDQVKQQKRIICEEEMVEMPD